MPIPLFNGMISIHRQIQNHLSQLGLAAHDPPPFQTKAALGFHSLGLGAYRHLQRIRNDLLQIQIFHRGLPILPAESGELLDDLLCPAAAE